MFNNFIFGKLDAKMHWQLFKILLLACNTASLFIYGFLHFILFDFPFETTDEVMILMKLFSVASSFTAGLCLLLLLTDATEYLVKRSRHTSTSVYVKTLAVAALLLVIILNACYAPVKTAVKKDFDPGFTSVYSNCEPGEFYQY